MKRYRISRANIGKNNTGESNYGDSNSGSWNKGWSNSGCYNFGGWNVGDYNFGKGNTGCYNFGDYNTGNWNEGNYNAGDYNIGNFNVGDWNKTDYSCGCFNTNIGISTNNSKILMFNKPSDWTLRDWWNSKASILLIDSRIYSLEWITIDEMTKEEKIQYPDCKKLGGYLRDKDEPDHGQTWWNNLSNSDKDIIKALPNFDPAIFKEITGINAIV